MFQQDRDTQQFEWTDIGHIEVGRPTMGSVVPVVTYRMMKYALRDALITELNPQRAVEIFVVAGHAAGRELCRHTLDTDQDLAAFLGEFKARLHDLGMGILAVEKVDADALDMVLTLSEDLDCSGLPSSDETVCAFDEGLLAGILEEYAARPFVVTEVACWARGDKLCRFAVYAT